MSTWRLARVQQAAKQLKVNEEAAAAAGEGGGSSDANTATVLRLGNDYAFAMDYGQGQMAVEYGRLSVMKSKGGEVVREGMLLLDDAKIDGTRLLCIWFAESGKQLKLGTLVHSATYSACCCLGEVNLKLADVEAGTYVFSDPSQQKDMERALIATKAPRGGASPAAPAPKVQETPSEAAARRQAKEAKRKAESDENARRAVTEVVRCKGKRKAKQAVL